MQSFTIVLLFLLSVNAWSHGEDKPGPHGGYIAMPGAFHIELVPVSSAQLKVYLLDMQFKNPSIKESRVDLTLGSTSAKCISDNEFFICDFPVSVDMNKPGELLVEAKREKQKGKMIKYSLPLKFTKK